MNDNTGTLFQKMVIYPICSSLMVQRGYYLNHLILQVLPVIIWNRNRNTFTNNLITL